MAGKILVVSDSHGVNGFLKKALAHFGERGRDLEMMIHLGDLGGTRREIEGMVDCPLEIVKGNCDTDGDLPAYKLVQIGDETAMITHGHQYYCKGTKELLKNAARKMGATMAFFGHTHIPLVDLSPDVKLLNPGSISLPKQESRKQSYMVVTLNDDGTKQFVVVEID